jgi:hypothetical protein
MELLKREEKLQQLAKNSQFCSNVSLAEIGHPNISMSEFCGMLVFKYYNYSKPSFYNIMEWRNGGKNATVSKKRNETKSISYKYPYIDEVIPEKLVATDFDILKVNTYTVQREYIRKMPDYDTVKENIKDAIEKLNPIKDDGNKI